MVQEIITDNLNRCPFCGGKAELKVTDSIFDDGRFMVRVHCAECHCLSNTYTTGQTQGFANMPSRYITLEEAKEKAAEAWNNRPGTAEDIKQHEREIYVNSLSFSEVAPMLEAAKLFDHSELNELIFCMNMAHLYGCKPRQEDGNNLYNFLVTLYHYGKVQGIRAGRARRKSNARKGGAV